MYTLVRRFIKTGIMFLAAGLLLGIFLIVQRDLMGRWPHPYLVSAHAHAVLVGFVMFLILGVGIWLFPRPEKGDTRYRPERIAAAYWILMPSPPARFVAEARQGQAEDLIGFMFDDLRPKLVSIGQSDWLVDAANRAEAYFTAVPPEQLSDGELFRRTEQMRLFGNVRLDRGDVSGALASFEAAHDLSEDLLRRDSTNAEWRLGLALDHFWLGNFSFQRGDFEAALEHFRAYKDHSAELVTEKPDDLQYRLELSYAHGNIGTVLEFMGDGDGAREEYLRSLEQKQALVDLDPENTEFQAALATAFNKVAVVEQQQGDLSTALGHHREELAVRQELAAGDEADMPARRDLSLAHTFLGELLLALGEQQEALEHQLAAWEIQQRLVDWDPADVFWRRGLANIITIPDTSHMWRVRPGLQCPNLVVKSRLQCEIQLVTSCVIAGPCTRCQLLNPLNRLWIDATRYRYPQLWSFFLLIAIPSHEPVMKRLMLCHYRAPP